MRSDLLAGIRWSVCMLKSHRSLCESFSRTGAGWCIYHLFVWSNWNFLHISQWITLPTSRVFLTSISWWILVQVYRIPQVSGTCLSTLADFNNAVVLRVSNCLLIFKSSSPFTKPLVTVQSVPVTIDITVTFMFHSFSVVLQSLSIHLSFCFLSVLPCDQSGQQNPLFGWLSYFYDYH